MGYRDCACRDCFDIAIGKKGALCSECEEAGCSKDGDEECRRDDAYGADEDLGALGRVSNGAIVGVALGALALWALWKKARS